jgi:hypothetical protein
MIRHSLKLCLLLALAVALATPASAGFSCRA